MKTKRVSEMIIQAKILILRKWALNITASAKEKPSQSLKSVMRKNSMSFDYLINNVKKFFHA